MNNTTPKSTLNFYKSEILTPGKNSMYSATSTQSQFTTYLSTCWKETVQDFQYIKHGLNITIKLDKSQDYIALIDEAGDYPYNYVGIQNSTDDRVFYYFIVGVDWRSANTIALSLAMDTVATYWDQIKMNDKTLVHREHKDRFIIPSNDIYVNSVLTRKVDEVEEGFGSLQVKDQTITVLDTALPLSTTRPRLQNIWYLVYRSEFEGTDANQSPVNCYLCADEDLQVESAGEDVTWNTSDLDDNKIYYAIVRDNPNAPITVENGSATIRTYQLGGAHSASTTYKVFKLYWDSVNNYWVARALYYNNGGGQTYGGYEGLNDIQDVGFSDGANIVWVATANQEIIDATDYTWIDRYYASSAYATETETGNTTDGFILSIDNSFDRTDTRILKIIELPYCPSDLISYNENDELWSYDSSVWTFVDAKLKLKSLGASFERFLGNFEIPDMNYTITATSDLEPNATRNNQLESKLYHSSISPLKFVYDSFTMDYARERYTHTDVTPAAKFAIDFKQTNTINSKLAFNVRAISGRYKENQDFETYLLASRNNESMIYNSEYLNYIRNGYNYDKKANALSVAQSIVGATIGAGGAVGRFAATVGKRDTVTSTVYQYPQAVQGNVQPWNASAFAPQVLSQSSQTVRTTPVSTAMNLAIGAASSAAQAAVNVGFQIAQNENTMEAKLKNLQMQSVSTVGADDLDLMKWYSNNTLREITYKPDDQMKEAILDLFYYAGYATEVRKIPNLYSRANWNFIQCDPVLEPIRETNIYQAYLDDIRSRFAAGLTIYHNANDFNQVSNNTEVALVEKIGW